MKKQFKQGMIAAVIALTFNSVYSQVPVEWTRTLQLEGYWEGPATLILSGQPFNLTYHTDFKTALDGIAMTMDEGFTDPSLGELKGANLIGLNASDGLIHWSSVDNFGTAHEHTGSWLNPKHFYMEHQSVQGGQAYVEKIDLKLRANNHKALITLVATLDADTVEILTGTLFRQNNCNRSANGSAENAEKDEITIYPNPAKGTFDITSSDIISQVKITNDSGQLMYEAKPGETDISIELKAAGIYFVEVSSMNTTEIKKVIVTK